MSFEIPELPNLLRSNIRRSFTGYRNLKRINTGATKPQFNSNKDVSIDDVRRKNNLETKTSIGNVSDEDSPIADRLNSAQIYSNNVSDDFESVPDCFNFVIVKDKNGEYIFDETSRYLKAQSTLNKEYLNQYPNFINNDCQTDCCHFVIIDDINGECNLKKVICSTSPKNTSGNNSEVNCCDQNSTNKNSNPGQVFSGNVSKKNNTNNCHQLIDTSKCSNHKTSQIIKENVSEDNNPNDGLLLTVSSDTICKLSQMITGNVSGDDSNQLPSLILTENVIDDNFDQYPCLIFTNNVFDDNNQLTAASDSNEINMCSNQNHAGNNSEDNNSNQSTVTNKPNETNKYFIWIPFQIITENVSGNNIGDNNPNNETNKYFYQYPCLIFTENIFDDNSVDNNSNYCYLLTNTNDPNEINNCSNWKRFQVVAVNVSGDNSENNPSDCHELTVTNDSNKTNTDSVQNPTVFTKNDSGDDYKENNPNDYYQLTFASDPNETNMYSDENPYKIFIKYVSGNDSKDNNPKM